MMAALSIGFALALFAVLLGLVELGRRVAAARDPASSRGAAAVEGAIFALMGLLIAFTFSAAQGRLDKRRMLIIDEANAIGTAYLRIDLASRVERDDRHRDHPDGGNAEPSADRHLPVIDLRESIR
jgi:hypothetical protein